MIPGLTQVFIGCAKMQAIDPSALLEEMLRNTQADTVNFLFSWAILGTLVVSIFLYKLGKARGLTHYAPNLLTSAGILGTFIGIVIGLVNFDPEDIDGSIALLLAGLQTAFMTSLIGMFSSIIFKLLTTSGFMQPKDSEGTGPDEVGPEDIHHTLRAQNDNLEKLRGAIAGEESDSLLAQFKLMRQDNREKSDRFDRFAEDLQKQMRDFAEMMSKSATEQVINALKEVIQDFNNQLTEQFGENFKALDASVKSLVEWQENYRHQLAEMRDQYAQGVTAITKTEEAVTHISDQAASIPDTMGELKTLLETTQLQLDNLTGHLEAFKDMRDRAVEAVPQIREQIDTTVREINTATQDASRQLLEGSARLNAEMIEGASQINERFDRVQQGLLATSDTMAGKSEEIAEQFDHALNDVNGHVRTLVESLQTESQSLSKTLSEAATQTEQHIQTVQTRAGESIDNMHRQLEKMLSEMSNSQSQEINRVVTNMASAMDQAVKKTGENIDGQLEAIDSSMQQELQRVMTEMGSALTQISGHFTKDYQQLTREMQKVVQTSNTGTY
jgi:chromosome segregation ATPase/predicted membrane protein